MSNLPINVKPFELSKELSPFQRAPVNQAPDLVGYNAFASDAALQEALRAHSSGDYQELASHLDPIGALAGTAQARYHSMEANTNTPRLRTVDRHGFRVDEVEFSPSWHWLMSNAINFGLGGTPWTVSNPDSHLQRAAGYYLWGQVETGHLCPVTMTYAVVPALTVDKAQLEQWRPLLASTTYDPGLRPPRTKKSIQAGMSMTEKQGGSDLRNSSTLAVPSGTDGVYVINGHKWFTSAPMCDIFLVLARTSEGISCFVVPRILDNGERNGMELVRLKDKLGNRSNASAEVEYRDSLGWLLGEPGRGIATIMHMVASTRMDVILNSASIMRRALSEAIWHANYRGAFRKYLIDKPLMQNVLADLSIEVEAAVASSMRLAAIFDQPQSTANSALHRIGLPIMKYWIAKRTAFMVAEALETLGGNGYIEESGLPQLYREAPLGSIWEGAGNVNALDARRAMQTHPESLDVWYEEVRRGADQDATLKAQLEQVYRDARDPATEEGDMRRLVADMATCFQASQLIQHGNPQVAELYCASRVGGDWRGTFGTLRHSSHFTDIIERSMPRAGQASRQQAHIDDSATQDIMQLTLDSMNQGDWASAAQQMRSGD